MRYVQRMTKPAFDAFWSYAHDDDTKSGGRVSAVAEALENEFSLVTGDDLELFLDRKSLKWGDVWRERIENAIGEVPFFIPIITPKFLKSEECRREFVKFSGEAKSRGFGALLLPILYIPIRELSEDNDDEVIALIARTQYFDWTPFRLLASNDPRVLKAVNDLALRIHELKEQATTTSLELEVTTVDDEVAQLQEAIKEIESRLSGWMEAVEFDRIAGAHWTNYRNERVARAQRLNEQRGAKSAIYSIFMQLGRDLLPIANDRMDIAKRYARLSIELDPIVTKAIRLCASHRELSPLLNPLRDGVVEAYLNIEPPVDNERDWNIAQSLLNRNIHLDEAAQTMQDSFVYVREGNRIVATWRDKIRELDGAPIVHVG